MGIFFISRKVLEVLSQYLTDLLIQHGPIIPVSSLNLESEFFQNWTSWKKHAYFFFHFGKSPGGFVSIFDRSVVRDPGILNPIFLELDFLEEHEYIIFNFEKSPGNVVKMFHGSVNISALINGCQRSWNSWKG